MYIDEEVQHAEVQVFGDGDGQVVVMGERECSVQRRNQKVLEATPGSRPLQFDVLFHE
jgi:urea carboxylase